MIIGLEHQAASVQNSDVCISDPSGKNEWAALRNIIWQVTSESRDTEITRGQCQFFTLPAQIHVLLRMWVMHIDTWHIATKLLHLQGGKGENIYVSCGGGKSELLGQDIVALRQSELTCFSNVDDKYKFGHRG